MAGMSNPSLTRRFFPILGLLLALASGWIAGRPLPTPQAHAAGNLSLYADALAAGWQNWSWNTIIHFNATTPVQSGSQAIALIYTAAWAGFYLHTDSPVDLASYDRLRFHIHGGAAGGQRVLVAANGDGDTSVEVIAPANAWQWVEIPFSSLGDPASLNGLWWQEGAGGVPPTFYLDNIQLVARTGPPPPTPPPGTGPALSVNVAANRKPISPHIYGMNFADEALAEELALPVNRWGGNAVSRYNWETDISNHAADWYFENIKESSATNLPGDSAAIRFIEQNRRTGAATLLSVPMSGFVSNSNAQACGFDTVKYAYTAQTYPDGRPGTDYQWRPTCGNGIRSNNGSFVTGNDPLDTSLVVTSTFTANWVTYLKTRYGAATAGGVTFYNLDNEPDLWHETHRDVFPLALTYDQYRDRSYQYAAAIKAADPTALILGPAAWGWVGYWYSPRDAQNQDWATPDDRNAHGGTPFVPWYLQQMQAYEQANGVRLLDYLDLHYYPQAPGVSLGTAGNAATQALRLRSTRSLWDATYVDESWIAGAGPEGGVVRLIPRMREWIAANYPGTRLAIGEYNWGGLEHINGALAQADVLGIFGREGLDLATMWAPPQPAQPGAFAFRIYRNYDSSGGRFGDVGVAASSSDQGQLAVYAAQRSTDSALTLVIINKTGDALTSNLALAGFTPMAVAQVYRYSADNLNAIVRQSDQLVTATGFTATFPANSITLVVIPAGSTPPQIANVYLPLVRK